MTSPYYRDGEALRAKHRLSADLQREFVEWVLGLVDLANVTSVLDVGCGWGRFLWPLAHRLSRRAQVVGTDASVGMLRTARDSGDDEITGLVAAHAAAL